jgi:hypothetical protein
VREGLLNHYRIFNAGDDLDTAAAAVAGLDVDVEYAFQILPGSMKTKSSCEKALRPGLAWQSEDVVFLREGHSGPAFGGRDVLRSIRGAGLVAFATLGRRHLCTLRAVRGEHAVDPS